MKIWHVAVGLSLSVFSCIAQSCTFYNSMPPNLLAIVQKNGGFDLRDDQCDFLNKHNLAVRIAGENTVLAKTAIGWALVTLEDMNGITADVNSYHTQIDRDDPSSPNAELLASGAIRKAIQNLDFHKAAREIAAKRARLKRAK